MKCFELKGGFVPLRSSFREPLEPPRLRRCCRRQLEEGRKTGAPQSRVPVRNRPTSRTQGSRKRPPPRNGDPSFATSRNTPLPPSNYLQSCSPGRAQKRLVDIP